MKLYALRLTTEERQAILDELEGCGNVAELIRKRISLLRDINEATPGNYEFRGLECIRCGDTTSHYRKYKSSDDFICDICGMVR